jgi:hypothetical protein
MKLQVTPFIRELVQLGARNDATRLGRMNDYLRILAVLQWPTDLGMEGECYA